VLVVNKEKRNKMFHYVYKITNVLNGKYYIGCRSTRIKPEDDKKYNGSGL
jgi:hypothetical protein